MCSLLPHWQHGGSGPCQQRGHPLWVAHTILVQGSFISVIWSCGRCDALARARSTKAVSIVHQGQWWYGRELRRKSSLERSCGKLCGKDCEQASLYKPCTMPCLSKKSQLMVLEVSMCLFCVSSSNLKPILLAARQALHKAISTGSTICNWSVWQLCWIAGKKQSTPCL